MKARHKHKNGFTLIEVVIVIAIIIILSAVAFFAISHYLEATDEATDLASYRICYLESAKDYADSRVQARQNT